jgi:hypothetical protein
MACLGPLRGPAASVRAVGGRGSFYQAYSMGAAR